MIGSSRHRWYQLAAFAVAGLMAGVACGQGGGGTKAGQPTSGGKVTVASWQEQDSLLAAEIGRAHV